MTANINFFLLNSNNDYIRRKLVQDEDGLYKAPNNLLQRIKQESKRVFEDRVRVYPEDFDTKQVPFNIRNRLSDGGQSTSGICLSSGQSLLPQRKVFSKFGSLRNKESARGTPSDIRPGTEITKNSPVSF